MDKNIAETMKRTPHIKNAMIDQAEFKGPVQRSSSEAQFRIIGVSLLGIQIQ
jgi:DNA-binding MarR family transcriptional regulator